MHHSQSVNSSHTPKLSPSLRTYTLPTLHGEGDVTEDSTSSLCVFNSEALHVHLAVIGPTVVCMRIVDNKVRASLSTRFPRQRLF